MLSEMPGVPRAAPATPLLSVGEAALFGGWQPKLHCGWVIELEAEPGLSWVAFI